MARRAVKVPIYKNVFFYISAILVLALAGFGGYALSTKNIVDKWDNKIYSGVVVKGIDLSGMTEDEAEEILNKKFRENLSDKKIEFSVDNKKYTYTYGDIEGRYNIEDTVSEALQIGKQTNMFKKLSLIKNKDNKVYNLDLDFEYNEEKLENIKEQVSNLSYIPAKDASINIISGVPNIVADITGCEVDKDDLNNKVSNFIENDAGKEVNLNINCTEIKAKILKSDLEKIKGRMSTASTRYAVGDRGKNLEIATSLVNGTILMPGETFSYDEVSQKGKGRYTFAGGYVNGKVEQVEAGGICQVSSALYRAVMRANIRSVERHNHMMPVGYAELGLDATVAWGYLDYKFKNTYDFPIYIEGIGGNGNVTFNIYGDPAALNGNKYELVAEYLGTDEQGNSRAKSYQVTYKNGVEINREYIATDIYKPAVQH